MLNMFNKAFFKKYGLKLLAFLLLFLAIVLILRIKIIREVIEILLLSFIIAYFLNPIKCWLIERFKIKKSLAAALIVFSILLIIIVSLAMLIPSLMKQNINIEGIIDFATEFIKSLMSKFNLNNYSIFNSIYEQSTERINAWIQGIFQNALDNIVALSDNILSLAVIPVVVYYFLSDGKYILDKILLILPTKNRSLIRKIIYDIDKVLARYIFSQFILCSIIAVFTFIGLLIIKLEFPLFLAIINGVFNIIPYFGPVIGALPAIFIAFMSGGNKVLITIVLFFLLQQIEGNILSPKITGDSISMHPIVIIILLLFGEEIGGFVGMILAVPIGVIIKVIYEDINYHLF